VKSGDGEPHAIPRNRPLGGCERGRLLQQFGPDAKTDRRDILSPARDEKLRRDGERRRPILTPTR
jgi:hypothetical protein